MTSFQCCRNELGVCAGVRNCLGFSVGIEIGLVLSGGSKLTLLSCAGRKLLVLSVGINSLGFCVRVVEIDSSFCVRAENNIVLCGHENSLGCVGGQNCLDVSVGGRKQVDFSVVDRN